MNRATMAGSVKQGATVPRFHRAFARWIDHEPRPKSATKKLARAKIHRFFESAEYETCHEPRTANHQRQRFRNGPVPRLRLSPWAAPKCSSRSPQTDLRPVSHKPRLSEHPRQAGNEDA
jgi:hypothetical protein